MPILHLIPLILHVSQHFRVLNSKPGLPTSDSGMRLLLLSLLHQKFQLPVVMIAAVWSVIVVVPTWIARIFHHMLLRKPVMTIVNHWVWEIYSGSMVMTTTV